LMLERICKPLAMKKTSFMRESGAESPANGAVSTANDYLKFLAMLLNGGEANGKQILSKQSVDLLLNPQAEGASVKFVPEPVKGFAYTFGGWVQESDRNGKPMVISSPGLFGTWPYIDKCRNYAAVIFTKQQSEQKKQPYLDIVSEIDEQIKGNCN
jgi:CubicO group peptidase (beta-lactamase class C family)